MARCAGPRTKETTDYNPKRLEGGKCPKIVKRVSKRLYTNIPHDKLRDSITFVLDEAFSIKDGHPFIRINKKSASWRCQLPKSTKLLYLTKDDIKDMFSYLLDNIHMFYRSKIFRQIIGIPMGTDCAPELANLFLFSFEYKYIMSLINCKDGNLKYFKYVYRYIDDLLTLNDNGHFKNIFKDIYPSELELKQTATSSLGASYLDMDIKVDEGSHKFGYTLYDKRNDFPFNVISMPNMRSNVPISPTYGVFYSQVIRIFKANNSFNDFINNIKTLVNKLVNQNFNVTTLYHNLNVFCKQFRSEIICKFSCFMSAKNFY